MARLKLKENQLTQTLSALGAVIECLSPLEIRQNHNFATGEFANAAINDLTLDACNSVIAHEVDEWHRDKNNFNLHLLPKYLGFSDLEYSRWVSHPSHVPEGKVTILIDKFLKEPQTYLAGR